MAKKKTAETANIKAAPVLRSGGDDPTPETPVITKSYCVRDDWKDQDKVNYVAFKSVDGEVQDLTVNGQPAGGGGASLVKVSIINDTAEELEVNVSHLAGNQPMLPAHMDYYLVVDPNSTKEIDALTLGEYSKIIAPGHIISTVTGEITIDSGNLKGIATIHGPGTVTISTGE